jgi:competence protein ComEA
LAAKIIAGRPYRQVDDLLRVTGIGSKLLEKVRPYVTVTK